MMMRYFYSIEITASIKKRQQNQKKQMREKRSRVTYACVIHTIDRHKTEQVNIYTGFWNVNTTEVVRYVHYRALFSCVYPYIPHWTTEKIETKTHKNANIVCKRMRTHIWEEFPFNTIHIHTLEKTILPINCISHRVYYTQTRTRAIKSMCMSVKWD